MMETDTGEDLHKKYPMYLPGITFKGITKNMLVPKQYQHLIMCSICGFILKTPTTLFCGHSFCMDCTRKCSYNCPICQANNSYNYAYSPPAKNIILSNIIDSHQVFCPSHFDKDTKPCNIENLTIATIQKHAMECPNITLKCACSKMIPKKDYLKPETECDCKMISCEYCSVPQKVRLLRFHSDICKEVMHDCENCGASFPRKEEKAHDQSCIVSCPFSTMGCLAKQLMMKHYQKHLVDAQEAHLIMALKKNYAETYEKIINENASIASVPEKFITIRFECKSKSFEVSIRENELLSDAIDAVWEEFDIPIDYWNIECWRKSSGTRLHLKLTALENKIQSDETLILSAEYELPGDEDESSHSDSDDEDQFKGYEFEYEPEEDDEENYVSDEDELDEEGYEVEEYEPEEERSYYYGSYYYYNNPPSYQQDEDEFRD